MSISPRTAIKKRVERLNQFMTWGWLAERATWTIEQAIAIQQIPAPTFDEAARAAYVAARFAELGLRDITTDELHNVYGRLPGSDASLPALMVSAHTDTVFPHDTDLTTQHTGDLIYGPGLGDNSMGVAGLLALVAALGDAGIATERDIWFVATSREEGLGDLGGIRAAYERLQEHIDLVINIEGLSFGYIYHAGIAVRRIRIFAQADGGHSWLHFGRPSAIHGLVNVAARITSLQLPDLPRTTYNIGMIEGGQSINSIATEAEMWLDMRSVDQKALAALEAQVRRHVETMSHAALRLGIEVVGDRPAGEVAPDHPLVLGALAALKAAGARGSLERGSTDGNIPLAAGCPTVTIGITRGGNAHRRDEYIETRPVSQGLQQLVLLALAVASPSFDRP